jgi:uncharacterized protein
MVRLVPYFADTSFWISLIDKREETHKAAHALKKRVRDDIVTSQLVMIELLAWFSGEGEHLRKATCKLVRELESGPIPIVGHSDDVHRRAFEWYERVSNDKKWSLVDCASFEIMRDMRITDVLTFDGDFAQAGFTVAT